MQTDCWQSPKDSDLNKQSQNRLFYHHTTNFFVGTRAESGSLTRIRT